MNFRTVFARNSRTLSRRERLQEVAAEIAVFADDPRHPHFERARDRMIALLQSGRVQNLQDAYDLAIVQLGLVR